MTDLAARLAAVHDRIRAAGGDPARTTVCAVTKGFGADAVVDAVRAGLLDVGENYAQEMLAKVAELATRDDDPPITPRWHVIGRLQRNKVRALAPHVHLWQSVDRAELGAAIARHAPGARVLVQVGATGEPGKGGCAPDDVPDLVDALLALGLDVRGLMTVGPTDATADPRPGFDLVAALAARLGLPEVSMGMSGDLEAAVAAGSTMVRVGTALFGPRRVSAPPAN